MPIKSDTLTKERTRLKNYLEASTYNKEESFIINRVKRKIDKLEKEREEILQKVIDIIESNKEYKKAYDNIRSITAVGKKSAAILLYLFLRYPNASRNQIVALCGLDAIERESGTSLKKKPKISKKGITLVRGNLFMPTLCSIQKNEELKAFYNRLVKRGKSKPTAIIATMRKMILLAHSLYKNDQTYDPKRYLQFTQTKKENAVV